MILFWLVVRDKDYDSKRRFFPYVIANAKILIFTPCDFSKL
jgi:hypothetical protein